jgi:hypothetical protein
MKLAFVLMAAINAGFTKTEARRASWRPRSDSRFSLADSERHRRDQTRVGDDGEARPQHHGQPLRPNRLQPSC